MSKNSPELINLRKLLTEELYELYWNKKCSFKKISDLFGVSPGAVINIYKKHGIKRRTCMEYKDTPGLLKLKNLSDSDLFNLYWNEKYSFKQIAKKFEISPTAVKNIYLDRGIKSRTNAESQTVTNEHRELKLSFIQEQLIYGSLLGDACLSHEFFHSNKTGRLLECYKIGFYHSCKFMDYVLYKRGILGIGSKTKKVYKLSYRKSGMGSLMVGFSFCHTPTLRKIAELCLNSRYKKTVSQGWLSKIDWPAVAFWYQDDGSLNLNRKTGARTLSFHTESFRKEEIVLLQKLLLKFGLTTKVGFNINGNPDQHIIHAHRKKEVNKFIENIKLYLIPCMGYKIRSEGLFRKRKINAENSV